MKYMPFNAKHDNARQVETLPQLNSQLRLALKAGGMGVWRVDLINDSITTIHGAGPLSAMPGGDYPRNFQEFMNLVYADDREALAATIAGALEGKCEYVTDFRIFRPDIGVRWIHARGDVIRDDSGRPVAMVGVDMDITDRKKADDALKEANRRFSSLVMTASDAVIMSDSNGCIVFWNAGASNVFGYSEDEVMGKSLTILMPERYREMHINGMNRVTTTGASNYLGRILDYEGLRKDGSEFPLHLSVNAWPTPQGVFFLGIVRDISDQKRIDEALKQQKLFAESLIEHSATATFVIKSDHTVAIWNKACAELTGVPASEIVGTDRHWTPFYPHKRQTLADVIIDGNFDQLPQLYDKYARSSPLSSGLRSEGWYSNLHGKDRYIVFDAAAIRDSDGRISHVIETLMDITEQKRLEEQLRHAQKLEGIGQLAGGIAHDFNNILNAIVGFGSLARMNLPREGLAGGYIDEVLVAANRAASLTHQLLAFGRKQMLDIKPINVNNSIGNLMKLLLRLIREDILLKFIPSVTEPIVMADSSQFDQVLVNLVTNARDALPAGGEITITTELLAIDNTFINMHGFGKTGGYALVRVSDNGEGMDEATRKKIFEPFFTTKEMGKGTGLGLAVVYGIIKQHNGFVNVYSEPGRGTTFSIYLPLAEIGEKSEKRAVSLPPEGGSETILVADDDEPLRILSKALLEQFGYTVITAVDGNDAVEKFRENIDRIDLVLLDAIMPNKNGKEAYEEIRIMKPEAKVVFLSGYTKEVVSADFIESTDVRFISKPVLPNELLKEIRQVLDGK